MSCYLLLEAARAIVVLSSVVVASLLGFIRYCDTFIDGALLPVHYALHLWAHTSRMIE